MLAFDKVNVRLGLVGWLREPRVSWLNGMIVEPVVVAVDVFVIVFPFVIHYIEVLRVLMEYLRSLFLSVLSWNRFYLPSGWGLLLVSG
jgi:hypothetical protein